MYTIHNQVIEFKSKKNIPLFTALLALSLVHMPEAVAQGTTTLYDPLVPGASSSLPLVPSRTGALPPPGSGSVPTPVIPGMTGPATLLPFVPTMPSNQVNGAGTIVPFVPSTALPPGAWGPLLYSTVPNSPSTPGANPAPYGLRGTYSQQALPTNVQATGGLPGTGGYNTTIPNIRAVATQDSITGGTNQYERRGRISFLGGGGNSQDIVTQFGPLAGLGVPFGVPTGPGYNNGPAGSNADNFNKSIDMGGGMRIKVPGVVTPLSTGKAVQDLNGYNVLYGSAVPSLGATRSTEFGQGAQQAFNTIGVNPNYSTDFGFPLRPQTGLNAHPNEPQHLLPQNAIETNF